MAKKKTKKASKKAVKKKAGAAKKKAGKVAKKTAKKTARKAPARKKAPVKKAVKSKKPVKAKKKAATPKKAAQKKQIVGEGDYAATRAFDSDQAAFVKKNKAKIPAMAKAAEAALDGPEGDALREAEATAAARSRDTF